MESGDNKRTHLEMIQDVINRMASNSFLLKGWSITIVSALFAMGVKDMNLSFVCIAFLPALFFWILDGYFLWQERLFRKLYDEVRLRDEDDIDFSMKTNFQEDIGDNDSWRNAVFSKTLKIFYIPVLIVILIVVMLVLGVSNINEGVI